VVRWRGGGELEDVGRRDGQVKVRGYRVEVGEIEGVMREQEGVREAVVEVRGKVSVEGDGVGHGRLVGYVVWEQGERTEELRRLLGKRLPEYMVPGQIVCLEELPLTGNGKVDRRALPDPDHSEPAGAPAFVAPRGPVEEVLAALWEDILDVEQVGVHDSFFTLGGHSLLAVQLTSRIREIFKIDLVLRVLFEAPTIAQLAERLLAMEPVPGQLERIAGILERIDEMTPEEQATALGAAGEVPA